MELIRLSKSCISEKEKIAVLEVLENEFLGMGPKVKFFEDQLSQYFDKRSVCVSSGTAALHLALQSVGIGRGDSVIVPSITYVATFQAISATGATPIPCDVCEDNFTINIHDAEKKIKDNTKAIIPVHYAGDPGDLELIYNFAKKYELRIIEDAAHAFGSIYKEKKVGSIGDIVCFSFDGIKNITSGEGGCIVSGDENVIQHISDARLLSVENDSSARYKRKRSWNFDVRHQGWRYHMSDIMAAIGSEQLKRFGELQTKRKILAKTYQSLLRDNPKIKILNHDYDKVTPHIYVVVIPESISRNELMKKMLENGIQTGIHYQPNHKLSKYKSNKEIRLPVTDNYCERIISLPLHPDLDISKVNFIVEKLLDNIK